MKKIIIGILLLFVIVGTIIFIITKNSKSFKHASIGDW